MSKCSFMLGDNGRLDKFTRQARDRCIREVIEPMARDGLRTISVAYRDFVLGKAEINQVIMQNCLGKSRIKCLPPKGFSDQTRKLTLSKEVFIFVELKEFLNA